VLCLVAPLIGFFQSFVPVARPIKFATPIGALSGNSVQVIFPAVVSMIAVGLALVAAAAGFVAVVAAFWPTIPVCAIAANGIAHAIPKIATALRINTP
jgi:hypothetical protein